MNSRDKKWEIQHKLKNHLIHPKELLSILLKNRGITTKKDIETFLHPELSAVTVKSAGISQKALDAAIKRIQEAVDKKEHIVVFGDYDVDGITGTAILWETLYSLKAFTSPYIPHRIDEGYGLSVKGIENILAEKVNVTLIITVDNGIVARSAVEYAKSKGIDVIITDHHMPEGEEKSKLPNAYAIVHTTKLCGAGVAWLFSKEINKKFGIENENEDHLAFAALGTVADLVPLREGNRVIVKEGLKKIKQTMRPGLLALLQEARIPTNSIGTYEIGHVIAPRLNAMGRLESAMDSLRVLCTTNTKRAHELAVKLSKTNRERQEKTKSAIAHARQSVLSQNGKLGNLLFISHESYEPGIIGLIAGRLVEEFNRPAIVISKGDIHAKASARSVHGFNMIEFIRYAQEHLVDAGGHPMAAGFTVELGKLDILQKMLEELAKKYVTPEHLIRVLRIDCELSLAAINQEFYISLQQLAPFGMGNPEPIFSSRQVIIEDLRLVGADWQHLKLHVFQNNSIVYEAIGFGMGEFAKSIKIGDALNIAYSITENEWNGNKSLQLKLKDISL